MSPFKSLISLLAFSTCVLAVPFRGSLDSDSPLKWSYNDPESWSETYPSCGGKNQSPVDICRMHLKPDVQYKPFVFRRYDVTPDKMVVRNPGYTVDVEWATQDLETLPSISGGGLSGEYVFQGFHLHWGSANSSGSEHIFEGSGFPGELHLVHSKKPSKTHPDEKPNLAVLAVLIDTKQDNPSLQPLIDVLKNIREPESAFYTMTTFPLDVLLPKEEHRDMFFRYQGSIATPPCSEIVTWTIFEKPISLSNRQLAEFRTLKDFDGKNLEDNFRPVQPLNGRKVLAAETKEPEERIGNYRYA